MAESDWVMPYLCPVCGRTFYITSRKDWAYKRTSWKETDYTMTFFCSWHCVRQYDKEKEERSSK